MLVAKCERSTPNMNVWITCSVKVQWMKLHWMHMVQSFCILNQIQYLQDQLQRYLQLVSNLLLLLLFFFFGYVWWQHMRVGSFTRVPNRAPAAANTDAKLASCPSLIMLFISSVPRTAGSGGHVPNAQGSLEIHLLKDAGTCTLPMWTHWFCYMISWNNHF